MPTTSVILFVIGIILVLDSLFVFLFRKAARNLLKTLLKKNNLKKIASWELVIGILVLIIAVLARGS